MDDRSSISRREFIMRMSFLGSLALTFPATALAELRKSKQQQTSAEPVSAWQIEHTWQTIAQVQEVLLPADEDVPGAGDIGATVYLHKTIENPQADTADKDFILRGVGWLDALTQEQHKKTFLQLTADQQQTILEAIVKSRAGRNWVSKLLTYTLEAMLADPVYGGNKNAAGWLWLEHQPGYPAPPEDKTWHQLLQRRHQV